MSPKPALPTAERRLLSYSHAAEYLGISLRSMKEIGGKEGQIRQVKIGHRVLFDRADLDAFVEKTKKAS